MRRADLDEDGLISFQEYKKIIQVGCGPLGDRKARPESGAKPSPSDSAKPMPTSAVIYL